MGVGELPVVFILVGEWGLETIQEPTFFGRMRVELINLVLNLVVGTLEKGQQIERANIVQLELKSVILLTKFGRT